MFHAADSPELRVALSDQSDDIGETEQALRKLIGDAKRRLERVEDEYEHLASGSTFSGGDRSAASRVIGNAAARSTFSPSVTIPEPPHIERTYLGNELPSRSAKAAPTPPQARRI